MSIDEIFNALKNGNLVCWFNTGYKVLNDGGKLIVVFKYNGYVTALHEKDLKEVFLC